MEEHKEFSLAQIPHAFTKQQSAPSTLYCFACAEIDVVIGFLHPVSLHALLIVSFKRLFVVPYPATAENFNQMCP